GGRKLRHRRRAQRRALQPGRRPVRDHGRRRRHKQLARREEGVDGALVGLVPMDSTLVAARPDGVTTNGYMQLSGTSFAAPVVSAAAANILARNPSFTPDQVKGALLLSAKPMAKGVGLAGGVGLVQAKEAADRRDAPNPNGALEQFTLAGG